MGLVLKGLKSNNSESSYTKKSVQSKEKRTTAMQYVYSKLTNHDSRETSTDVTLKLY